MFTRCYFVSCEVDLLTDGAYIPPSVQPYPPPPPQEYYMAPPPGYYAPPPYKPPVEESSGMPWFIWVGVGALVATVFGKVRPMQLRSQRKTTCITLSGSEWHSHAPWRLYIERGTSMDMQHMRT